MRVGRERERGGGNIVVFYSPTTTLSYIFEGMMMLLRSVFSCFLLFCFFFLTILLDAVAQDL